MTQSPLEARFWSHVNKNGPIPEHVPELGQCWNWTGKPTNSGYGQFQIRSISLSAFVSSRAAWYFTYGVIPELCVLHKCDNRLCCNPAHLFLGTRGDNARDAIAKDRPVVGHKGSRNGFAKLTESTVRAIRSSYQKGVLGCGYIALSKKYGVSMSCIRSIISGRTWPHIQ